MGASYSRVPVAWLRGWLGAGLSPLQMAVMVELCRWRKPDGTAWCPRRKMAEELGTTEQSVSNAMAALRRAGLVRLVARGGPGRATVYVLCQSMPKPTDAEHLPGISKRSEDSREGNTYPTRLTEHLPNAGNPIEIQERESH